MRSYRSALITFQKCLSNLCWTTSRQMSNLPKVYVRHVEEDESLKISFNYGNSLFSERLFNFNRRKNELLESTINRIQAKIADNVNKKKGKKKTAQVSPVIENLILVSLICNDQIIDGNVENERAWKAGCNLKVGDALYEICENPPTVVEITLPKTIFAGFVVYPKISLEHCSLNDCEFVWYRKILKHEITSEAVENFPVLNIKGQLWLTLHKGFLYMTSASDVGRTIKVVCVPACDDKKGPPVESISNVSTGPIMCPFEERHEHTKEVTDSDSIRCTSYNILADLYADSDTARNELFPYCPANALDLDYRKQLYMKEIMGYNSDIICLQEVDRKVFLNDLKPVFALKDLECVFNQKGGQVAEGLSCLYRSSKFKCIHSESIILSDAVGNDSRFQSWLSKLTENEHLLSRVLQRTTALQVVLLESIIHPNRRILVGNTHLYFHPESDNIRLIQSSICIHYLENLLKKFQEESPISNISLLLCGDFNSCPEFGVYQLMTKNLVPADCPDWKSCPEEEVHGMPLSHSLSLGSACGTPLYTNYTEAFNGCLDYIFYDRNSLSVEEVVPFPNHEQVTQHTALPSVTFPSDHIALVCTLKWK